MRVSPLALAARIDNHPLDGQIERGYRHGRTIPAGQLDHLLLPPARTRLEPEDRRGDVPGRCRLLIQRLRDLRVGLGVAQIEFVTEPLAQCGWAALHDP